MSEYTKNRLICATRQFRHNDDNTGRYGAPEKGFVCAYDIKSVDDLIAELEAKQNKIRALVNEQAEDEGLWFKATTVTEAYLQQELRRLHGVIEDEGSSDTDHGND